MKLPLTWLQIVTGLFLYIVFHLLLIQSMFWYNNRIPGHTEVIDIIQSVVLVSVIVYLLLKKKPEKNGYEN